MITFDDVTFAYSGIEVLSNATFAVERGDFVGVIGPNGGGKTTLLKLILGFLKPKKGKVIVDARRPIGYVPQQLPYDRSFPISVLEVVLSGRLFNSPMGGYGKENRSKAFASLEQVGIADYANASFASLSGGQAQRALIARALASEPELLLLDESFSHVDVEGEASLYKLLEDLSVTILMVTHNLDAALNHVKRILTVHQHVETLSPKEMCEHYSVGLYHGPVEDK